MNFLKAFFGSTSCEISSWSARGLLEEKYFMNVNKLKDDRDERQPRQSSVTDLLVVKDLIRCLDQPFIVLIHRLTRPLFSRLNWQTINVVSRIDKLQMKTEVIFCSMYTERSFIGEYVVSVKFLQVTHLDQRTTKNLELRKINRLRGLQARSVEDSC